MKSVDIFKNDKKAIICFLTCGYPTPQMFEEILEKMEKFGVDAIEVGIPFSDPTAEAAIIQKSNICALNFGVTTDKAFECVQRVSEKIKIPIVIKAYANVVFSYGTERFIKKLSEMGVFGLMLEDVPYEEKAEFSEVCDKYGVLYISTVAPAAKSRMKEISKSAKGYVHIAQSPSLNGKQACDTKDVIKAVKAVSDAKAVVGYENNAQENIKLADGVYVSEAIIDVIEGCKGDYPNEIERLLSEVSSNVNG